MNLSTHIKSIIDKQKLSGYSFPDILQAPANRSSILQIESALNFKLNEELIELYSYADGTISNVLNRSNLISIIPFYDFLSLKEAGLHYRNVISQEDVFYNSEKAYRPKNKLFPFLEEDGGNCFWVDLNEESPYYGKIYWTNTLTQEPDYLFNSLTAMFKTISGCYANNIIKIDNDGILSCNYSEWGKCAEVNNPGITYWKSYNGQ